MLLLTKPAELHTIASILMALSCCYIDNCNRNYLNARAGAGVEAREPIRTAHQLTVEASPALVTRALVRA